MNPMVNAFITALNSVGEAFCKHAAGVFVQSALLVVVLFVVDLILRRRVRAVFRYCVWLLVLLKLVLPPTLSLPTGIGYWASDHLPPSLNVSETPFDLTGLAGFGPPVEKSHSGPSDDLVEAAPPLVVTKAPPIAPTWRAIIFILWVMGVVAFLALLIQRARFVSGLIAASTPATAEFAGVLEQCRRQIGVRLKTKLRVSETISSPAVCGFFRPIILIPAALVGKLSTKGLRAILIHELAHIKRADLWVNSIQTLLQVIYFYNPFVWFANAVIRKVCEEAVDETVLVTLGGRAQDYSNTLIDIGEMAFWKADLGLRLIGVAESKKALQWRIRHMLTRPIPKTSKLGFLGIAMVICIAAILLPMSKAEKAKTTAEALETNLAPKFVKMWPEVSALQSRCFYYPAAPAVDSSGNVYVVDLNRILKFSSDGVFVAKWGGEGSDEGQIDSPEAVAVDSFDNVYVLEAGNKRVQKFSSDGKFITAWGGADGEFKTPHDIALDASGNVYVADTGNHRIQKFTSDGDFIATWGSEGSDEGQFSSPSAVAVDDSGSVYVAEVSPNNRIQKFTSDAKFITKWGGTGREEGEFRDPVSVAVDRSGNIHVLDRDNLRIQTFTRDGNFIATWDSQGDGDWRLRFSPFARGISLDKSGNVYIADQMSIKVFTSNGGSITTWGSQGSGEGEFNRPLSVAVDNSGNVYVTDSGNNRIQKFASDGGFITKWDTQAGEGQFYAPLGLAVDNSGNVYVGEKGNRRIQKSDCIQKFDSDGKIMTTWGSEPGGPGQFRNPWGLAVDNSGNVYISGNVDHCIQKLTSTGKLISKWGSKGSDDGEFNGPLDVALDTSGNVYVVDVLNNRVQKFTSDGTFIAKWGSEGSADGEFKKPSGVAVDRSGNVYVADSGNHRIQKFSSKGQFIVKWGSAGSDEGRFGDLIRVAADDSGNIYVADMYNNRIQKFQQLGESRAATR